MQESLSFVNKKILLLTPARLGDTLFCTPGVKLLKQYFPASQFDLLAMSDLSAEIFHHNPAVQNIYLAENEQATSVLAQKYDLAMGLHCNKQIQSHLAAMTIPTLQVQKPEPNFHQSWQATQFVKALLPTYQEPDSLGYCLYPQPVHLQTIARMLNDEQNPMIAVHLGCHSLTKKSWQWWRAPQHEKVWALHNFIQLAKNLKKDFPTIRFVLTGSAEEQKLAKKFVKAVPGTINLIGKTSVLELAALLQKVKLVLTCDTGVLHVAAAMQTNLIALFGPTNPIQTGPYPLQKNYKIVREKTMNDIKIASVYAAIVEFIPDGFGTSTQ